MSVQLNGNGKVTEKQRKYLGWLSSRAKEIFGKDFSIRKLAEQKGVDWLEMTQEQASELIDEVRKMIEEQEFFVTEEELIQETIKGAEKRPEQRREQANSQIPFIIIAYPSTDKVQAIKEVLKAMAVEYKILAEVER